MFCITSFLVLSILGIFSASNRQLAKEALDCVLRRVTFRPCTTGFDEKMKAKILGFVITRSEGSARFLNRFFEPLAWGFFILTIAAMVFFARGIYLFYVTGSCNGLNSSAFCVFDPTGENNQVSNVAPVCKVPTGTKKGLTMEGVDLTGLPQLNTGAQDKIFMIGCYHCDYTRKSYPEIRQLVNHFGVEFTYINYPVKETDDEFTRIGYCVYQQDPAKYWQMNDLFFTGDKAQLDDKEYILKSVSGLGVNMDTYNQCVSAPETEAAVKKQMDEVVKTQFYGTPTIFFNAATPMVGPKPYRVYAIQLKGLFFWLK